ncbi:MAG TPA: hypothetical protein VF525_10320 [Pyrinomonadaceae bacterium]
MSATRTRPRTGVLCTLLLFICGSAAAQQTTPTPAAPSATMTQQTDATPAADPKDVASIEAILAAVYDVISGPAGQPRNWARMRSLFLPGARLIPTARQPDGTTAARVLDVAGYVERASKNFAQQGFYERAVVNRVEQFGQIAHVFSTYEARHDAKDAQPFLRGINSIQLMNDGKRWWVVTIFWQAEDAQTPLPPKYLKQ